MSARSAACSGSRPGSIHACQCSLHARFPGLREYREDPRVRVLHVVHGVLTGLLDRQVEVEVDGRVVRAGQQVPAHRVHADLGHQVVEGDELPGSLRHLRALAAPHQVDELHDQQLQLRRDRRPAPRRRPSSGARSHGGRRPTRRSGDRSRARACTGGRRCPRRSRCARRLSEPARGPCRRRSRSCAATARPRSCRHAPAPRGSPACDRPGSGRPHAGRSRRPSGRSASRRTRPARPASAPPSRPRQRGPPRPDQIESVLTRWTSCST